MPQIVTVQETDNGELFFDIPEDILELLGWEEGTELDWTVVGDSIRITRADSNSVLGVGRVGGDLEEVSGSTGRVWQTNAEVVDEPSF